MLFDTVGVITAYDCRESLLVTADYLFYANGASLSNFMPNGMRQFSRWGAPREQRDEVTADIWELAHKWMQTLQTERT